MNLRRLSFRTSNPRAAARWQTDAADVREWIETDGPAGVTTWSIGKATGRSNDPFAAFDRLARDGRRWAGYVGYEFNRFVERLPPVPSAFVSPLPTLSFWPIPATAARFKPTPEGSIGRPRVERLTARDEYLGIAARAIRYIGAGDVFQVNVAQTFDVTTPLRAEQVWDRIAVTPATYGALIDLGEAGAIVSNSPELFFRVEPLPDGRRRITTRPIKGTRPRAPGMREALANSEKDRAELAMIVDLERNDLGRICEIGSVRVVEPRAIEEHPTVYHGVATIDGILRDDVTLADVFRAMFPCGSITGCPKVRAMEIIDELEPIPRGPYCGAIGYVDPDGVAEFSVAIRTMTMANGIARVSVGGGIVADSRPDAEHDETIDKARAMLRALGVDDHGITTLRAGLDPDADGG